jgi:chorismate synthase
VALLEGLPHGLRVDKAAVDGDLKRRQMGFGRGGRMKIETDMVEVVAGLRGGLTLGAPLAMLVRNADFANWTEVMAPFGEVSGKALTRPRPGHADLSGSLKLALHDARDVLERSSARSTVARVAAGAVCKALLRACGADMMCHVTRIGDVAAPAISLPLDEARAKAEASEVRCVDDEAGQKMMDAITAAQKAGDSLGGVVEVICWGLPAGLGSHVEWDLRLDGRIAQALMSIQAMKGVEVGMGFETAARPGSEVHDPIHYIGGRFSRPSNHAGGIEGGNTNGEAVVARAAMKPIPTLARPLASVDLETKESFDAQKERTDSCAVPAAAVVAEAALAFVLADALLDKTGGDSMDEVLRNLKAYKDALAAY